ncbi:hypothetical protein D3Z09_18310 [Rahnella aquatilis]|nr:hypothetical protein D3Z09_18310 [Rahnella aquatilis]
MRIWAGLCRRAGVLCLLSGSVAGGLAYGALPPVESEKDYPVQVTILAGTCSVKLLPSSPPPVVNVLDEDMAKGGIFGTTKVRLITTDCLGVGEAGKTPSVKVTGWTYDQAEKVSSGIFSAGPYLFYNQGSSLKWAGFVLSKTEQGGASWEADPASTYVKNDVAIPLDTAGGVCSETTGCGGTTFWAGLSCGATPDCAEHFGQQANVGTLSASITFTFLYD